MDDGQSGAPIGDWGSFVIEQGMFHHPLSYIGKQNLDGIPEYPIWQRWRRDSSVRTEDWYYFTRYDGEVRVLNAEYGLERSVGHHIVFLCPLTRDGDDTWIGLTKPYSIRECKTLEELVHYRDWVFTNLPIALILGALS